MKDRSYRDRRDPVFERNSRHRRPDPNQRATHQSDRYHPRQHPDGQRPINDGRRRDPEYPPTADPRYRSAPGSPRDNRSREPYSDERHDPQHSITYPVTFHGKSSEYFKIWIVNIFLTIITLYIYSAWAKVRTKRYFYGNTSVDGSTFEYHATGKQLVAGRLIAATLVITYTLFQGINTTLSLAAFAIIVLMFPWAIWRSLKFNAKASSFRNIRFGFDGNAATPYLNFLIIPVLFLALIGAAGYFLTLQYGPVNLAEPSTVDPELIRVASVGIFIAFIVAVTVVVPLLHRNLISYSHNNHRYGTARFAAGIKAGRIYGIHFVAVLLSILALLVVSGLIFGAISLFSKAQGIEGTADLLARIEPHGPTLAGVAVYLILVPATGLAIAYFQSAIRNHRYNATSIDSRVRLNSATGTWSLWWLSFSNLMLILLTLGLAYPFTKIRTARYFAKHTSITVAGGLESFTANERTKLNAMGEEMADAFDVEFDIGI